MSGKYRHGERDRSASLQDIQDYGTFPLRVGHVWQLMPFPGDGEDMMRFLKKWHAKPRQTRHKVRARLSPKQVSAIVPNYNYARYLEKRLQSIISQSYPLHEIIVLDDASTDDSRDVIQRCLTDAPLAHRFIQNNRNSGSVFEQWKKGVETAEGDFIWICEADDCADPLFVERAMQMFDDSSVVLSYAQSRTIDEFGAVLENDYLYYTDDIDPGKWRADYVSDGCEELATAMAIKNTVPNVSAAIFRKRTLHESLVRCQEDFRKLKIAGDWLIYADILQYGRIGFVSETLNSHRRHRHCVSIGSSNTRQMAEILFMQRRISGLVPVSKKNLQKANAYAKSAYAFLGIQPADIVDPVMHPEVCSCLQTLMNVAANKQSCKCNGKR